MQILTNRIFVEHFPVSKTLALEVYKFSGNRCFKVNGILFGYGDNWRMVDVIHTTLPNDINSDVQNAGILQKDITESELNVGTAISGNSINLAFGSHYFSDPYTSVIVKDLEELSNLLLVLSEGRYCIIFESEISDTISLQEFISTLEPHQSLAVKYENNVIWMGLAKNLQPTAGLKDILHLPVKGINFTRSIFSTYFGGGTQNWSGLLIDV